MPAEIGKKKIPLVEILVDAGYRYVGGKVKDLRNGAPSRSELNKLRHLAKLSAGKYEVEAAALRAEVASELSKPVKGHFLTGMRDAKVREIQARLQEK